MTRRRVLGFSDPRTGEWRELRDPDGPPTWRQLVTLYRAGALTLTEPGSGESFTKAEAAAVIDDAGPSFAAWLQRQQERDDHVGDFARAVASNPGWPVAAGPEVLLEQLAQAGAERTLRGWGVLAWVEWEDARGVVPRRHARSRPIPANESELGTCRASVAGTGAPQERRRRRRGSKGATG